MADSWVRGLHHVTGAATSGQKDYDFYTGVLGLRMVKKTINHETADQWHLFYGDRDGNAGTIMTNFIFEDAPLPPYRRGAVMRCCSAKPRRTWAGRRFWRRRFRAAPSSAAWRPIWRARWLWRAQKCGPA